MPEAKVFEIWHQDLTSEAQKRLYDLVGDEVATGPLAIIEFEDDDPNDFGYSDFKCSID